MKRLGKYWSGSAYFALLKLKEICLKQMGSGMFGVDLDRIITDSTVLVGEKWETSRGDDNDRWLCESHRV